jgi:hypothetical protein
MDEKPKRRWFRFRLSTVLILTAIVAWGMATWPDLAIGYYSWSGTWQVIGRRFWQSSDVTWSVEFERCGIVVGSCNAVAWPALSLAAFLAWKAAWAVAERRRARRATQV